MKIKQQYRLAYRSIHRPRSSGTRFLEKLGSRLVDLYHFSQIRS